MANALECAELPEAPAEDLTLRCTAAELVFEVVRRIPGGGTVRQSLGNLDRPLVAVRQLPFGIDKGLASVRPRRTCSPTPAAPPPRGR